MQSPSLDASAVVPCPWCGEPTDSYVDPSAGAEQSYIEDCVVCCRPIRFEVSEVDGTLQVQGIADR